MRTPTHRSVLCLAASLPLLLAALAPVPAMAGGLLLDPATASSQAPVIRTPIEVRIAADVRAQVATTTAEIVFPKGDAPQRFLFPLPPSAAAVGFETWDGTAWKKADLDTSAPAGTPEVGPQDLNARLRAHLGDNPFVIDLPGPFPGGRARVRLTWIEVLPYDFGEVAWTVPLDPGPFGPYTADELSVDVRLETLRDLESHVEPFYGPVDAQESSPRQVTLHLDRSKVVVDHDFTLRYREKQDGFFFRLLTDHESCGDDGFFLLIVEPEETVSEGDLVPKDFTFIVDRSGSMDGYKIDQARNAARFAVDHLYDADRFNVIAYDDQVDTLFNGHRDATESNKASARSFIGWLAAGGSTDIDQAVQTALSGGFEAERARLILLLTDGQPTVGVTNPTQIRADIRAANRDAARIYAFGIGADVDREFLTALSAENYAEARFLDANADIEGILEEFFLRINRPVLTDVSLDFGGHAVSETYPKQLTDVFAGSQIFVLGRYQGGGTVTMSLGGQWKGASEDHPFEVTFPECALDENAFIPRLWAKAKIDWLLAEIAKGGYDQDQVDEVVALATKYGIQTPYTSFGVDPSDPGTDPGAGGNGTTDPGSNGGGGNDDDGWDWDWGSSGGVEDEVLRGFLAMVPSAPLVVLVLVLMGFVARARFQDRRP